ncbi:hypothetical protein Pint_31626 [Pistacia integerrima]|uniref:Uncharacterized protein n=2 Tax=Pistacia TaxID=55512 RepID=A0ACC0XNT6_9ROSI|nr:hypothetical protein Pint_31626 [Pistacia integerrima]
MQWQFEAPKEEPLEGEVNGLSESAASKRKRLRSADGGGSSSSQASIRSSDTRRVTRSSRQM